jgi:TonB family protein
MKCAIPFGVSLLMLAQPGHSAAAGAWDTNFRPPYARSQSAQDKPNPLTLLVEVRADRKLLLNREEFGSLDDLARLTRKLRDLFASREAQRAYREGMETRTDLPESERVEKTVYIHNRGAIDQPEIAKLLTELKATGANPVTVLSEEEYQAKYGWLEVPGRVLGVPPIKGVFRGGLIHAGELNGSAAKFPKPAYPRETAKHISGEVRVNVVIDESGKVISARAVSGHPLLRAAAVEAARQAEFPPALHNGKPVKVSGFIVYTFVG